MKEATNPLALSAAGMFYRGRDEWMRALTSDPDITPMAKLVGCYLAMRINKNTRNAFPQQTTIAKELAVSRWTVMRSIAELTAALWIEVETGQRGKKRAVNRYSLVFGWTPK